MSKFTQLRLGMRTMRASNRALKAISAEYGRIMERKVAAEVQKRLEKVVRNEREVAESRLLSQRMSMAEERSRVINGAPLIDRIYFAWRVLRGTV